MRLAFLQQAASYSRLKVGADVGHDPEDGEESSLKQRVEKMEVEDPAAFLGLLEDFCKECFAYYWCGVCVCVHVECHSYQFSF